VKLARRNFAARPHRPSTPFPPWDQRAHWNPSAGAVDPSIWPIVGNEMVHLSGHQGIESPGWGGGSKKLKGSRPRRDAHSRFGVTNTPSGSK
jgi:hypothetical protein